MGPDAVSLMDREAAAERHAPTRRARGQAARFAYEPGLGRRPPA
jgi:hypothetical protein